MFDQPDYSDVEHESCEDPTVSCPICGEDHVEAVCPMLNCERCGQHAAWNEIDHDSEMIDLLGKGDARLEVGVRVLLPIDEVRLRLDP